MGHRMIHRLSDDVTLHTGDGTLGYLYVRHKDQDMQIPESVIMGMLEKSLASKAIALIEGGQKWETLARVVSVLEGER